jgi:CHAT domain-containing protein
MADTGGTGIDSQAGYESMQANLEKTAENLGVAAQFQDEITALKNDANYKMKADQLYQDIVNSIKT